MIEQLARAAGAAYTRRFEALRTLVRHPGAQRHVVKAIGRFVTDPAAQVVMHPLTLLQEVEHWRAGDLTTRLLTTETGMLQQGAAWVTAAKIARRHYDADALKQLEGAVIMLLATNSRGLPDVDVLDVAARLPGEATKRILRALRDTALQPRLELILRTGELLHKDITRHVAGRMAKVVEAATPRPYNIEPDLMLQRLLREALFHGHQERRHQAAVMLTASPYRRGVAAACANEIRHGDETVALQAAMLLRHVATEAQKAALLAWAQDESRPQIRDAALVTLGRLSQGLGPDDEALIFATLRSTPKRPTQRAAIYALGMGGSPYLKELAESDDEYEQRAAGWWLSAGPAIHESSMIDGQD